ncbi:MAG: PTS sugar transporter subunit IIA [Spirochaetes bacterium]|nr:PTS sugar transporter subunit IIA [Spirochaetota bacterium]
MIKLSNYISKENIFFIDKNSKLEIFDEIFEKVKNNKYIKNIEIFKNLILEREKIVSTGIGMGFAVPHIKNNIVEEFFISIFILEKPVDWNSIDNKPVKVIFLIAGPENHNLYLQILSKLILIIRNFKERKALLNSKNLDEIYSFFYRF